MRTINVGGKKTSGGRNFENIRTRNKNYVLIKIKEELCKRKRVLNVNM